MTRSSIELAELGDDVHTAAGIAQGDRGRCRGAGWFDAATAAVGNHRRRPGDRPWVRQSTDSRVR